MHWEPSQIVFLKNECVFPLFDPCTRIASILCTCASNTIVQHCVFRPFDELVSAPLKRWPNGTDRVAHCIFAYSIANQRSPCFTPRGVVH